MWGPTKLSPIDSASLGFIGYKLWIDLYLEVYCMNDVLSQSYLIYVQLAILLP